MAQLKMSKPLALATTSALVFTLAGCGGSNTAATNSPAATTPASTPAATQPAGTPASAENVELTFWTLGTNDYAQQAEEYTKSVKPNVKIKIQNTSDQTVHHNNMLTALQAGKGAPDIFMLEIGFLDRFVEARDKFVNLYDLGAKDIKGNYLDWKWKQTETADGSSVMGLPTDVGPTVTYYRTDLIQQAGLPTEPDKFYEQINTWDKFFAVAKTVKEKTGKNFIDMPDLLFNAIRDQGSPLYYDNDDKFVGDTNPQVKKAWDLTAKAIAEGWVGPHRLWTPEWGQAQNKGDFAVILAPAWMSGVIKGNAPDSKGKWQITQMPEGSGNWGGSFITLPKEGKHQKEAYAFISWLVSKERQLVSFKTGGLMPSIPALYDDPNFTGYKDEYYNNQAVATEFGKAAKTVKPVRYGKLHDSTDAEYKNALQDVLVKKKDPAKAWEDATKKIVELNKRS